MVYAQLRICPREWDAPTLLGFWDTNRSLNLGQTTRSYNSQQKKRTCRIVTFAVSVDNRVKLKECEKRDKYFDLARELKKSWKVTIIPIVIGTLGTDTKELVQGLDDLEITERLESIQTTALLRSARILRRVLETWGDLLSLKLQWETIIWREKLS